MFVFVEALCSSQQQGSYRHAWVKFKDFSRTSKSLSYSFQGLEDNEKYWSAAQINTLYTNGFLLLVWYNKFGIVHCAYLGESGCNFKKKDVVFFCPKIFLTFTNSVDTDEMQHYAAFHQGLHCLQKYSFKGFPNTKG